LQKNKKNKINNTAFLNKVINNYDDKKIINHLLLLISIKITIDERVCLKQTYRVESHLNAFGK